jgi:hypothetical protein
MKYHSRKFLNKNEGTGAIECHVDQSHSWVDAGIKIADCSRQVTIEFSFGSMKDAKARREKLKLITDELVKMMKAIDDVLADPELRRKLK